MGIRGLRRRWAIAAVTGGAMAALALPATASAGTVSITGSTLTYSAAAGEPNEITIEKDASVFRVTDAGATATAGTGCNQRSLHRVNCPTTGINLVEVLARDGNDSVQATIGTTDANLSGGSGTDSLRSDAGDDTLSAGKFGATANSQETLFAGDGQDVLNANTDTAGGSFLQGGPGDDQLNGGPGGDSLFGDTGADELRGGNGFDFVSFNGTSGINVTMDDVANDGEAGENDNVHSDIEFIFGTAFADTLVGTTGGQDFAGEDGPDTIQGGPGDDSLTGSDGADTLTGEEGNDTVQGGNNADDMSGGAGEDLGDYSDHSCQVTVTINNTANDGCSAGAEGDNVRTDVEDLRGGSNDDTLTGSTGDNQIEGQAGADNISGIGGDDSLYGDFTFNSGTFGSDTLNGGNGDDDLFGGGGGDDLSGGNDFDTVGYRDFAGSNPLTITVNDVADDGVAGENDNVRVGVEAVVGGEGDDTITGSGGTNTLVGSGGADSLHGAGGNDTLQGDQGCCSGSADVLDGGSGEDAVTYEYSFNSVTADIDGVADDGISGGAEGDNVMTTVENLIGGHSGDSLTGNNAANNLLGRQGSDTLNGGGSGDSLAGGDGIDTLNGEAGKDELQSRGDGAIDNDNCGTEADVATADAFDNVNADCETVLP
jgi:Ca2+-binding RTX toxin-like protein